jgi:hypothetical protein
MRAAHIALFITLSMSALLAGNYFLFLQGKGAYETANVPATANVVREGLAFNPDNTTGMIIIIAIMAILSAIVILKGSGETEVTQKQ